uniref:Uncharacterized protein n=1 Tax=Anguilla anguilla TaxID=7936 RepID=A0A0E9T2N3_ANGAN
MLAFSPPGAITEF